MHRFSPSNKTAEQSVSFAQSANAHRLLFNFLREPDPQRLLRNSRVIEHRNIFTPAEIPTKQHWEGALSSQVRDQSLRLAFDEQMRKLKWTKSLANQSIKASNKMNSEGSRHQRSFSVKNRYESDSSHFLNSSSIHLARDYLENSRLPTEFIEEVAIDNFQNYASNHPTISPTRENILPQNIISPLANSNSCNNSTINTTTAATTKSFSIKYIGMHNNIIGVLSRKMPLECSPDRKNSKSKLRWEQTSEGKRSAAASKLEQRPDTINSEKLDSNEKVKIRTALKLLSSHQKMHGEEVEQNEVNSTKLKNDINGYRKTSEEDKGSSHSFDKETMPSVERPQTPVQPASSLNNKFYGKPIQSQAHRVNNNSNQILLEPSRTPVIKSHADKYVRPASCFDSRAPLNASLISTTASTAARKTLNANIFAQTHTQNSTSKNFNSSGVKDTISKQNEQPQLQQQQSQIQQKQFQNQQPQLQQVNTTNPTNPTSDQSIPNPKKYDKFLVNKYSVERSKLVALKKPKEENPWFQKKQLFTFLNNY